MFGQFLLEQGVEIELPVGINSVLGFLDEEIPKFRHKEYCYDLSSNYILFELKNKLKM